MRACRSAIILVCVSLFAAGCCNDRSLIKRDMSMSQIEIICGEHLDGLESDRERLEEAAKMVDWEHAGVGMRELNWVPIVRWDAESNSLFIPVQTLCYLGAEGSGDEIAVSFDDRGIVRSATKQRKESLSRDVLRTGRWLKIPQGFVDPWESQSPQNATPSIDKTSIDGDQVVFDIQYEDDSNRFLSITFRSLSNDPELLRGKIRIFAGPNAEVVVLDSYGPFVDRNPYARSLIVDDPDLFTRSGNWEPPTNFPYDIVPEYELLYQCLVMLSPHDGVALTVEIIQDEVSK